MTKSSLLLVPFVLAAALNAPAARAGDADQVVASLCDYVASNDKNRLRDKLKDAGIRLHTIYDGVRCNGMSLLRFAMDRKAEDAGEFIAKKLPGSLLSKAEDDGNTVLVWAETNGFGQSGVAMTIRERLN